MRAQVEDERDNALKERAAAIAERDALLAKIEQARTALE